MEYVQGFYSIMQGNVILQNLIHTKLIFGHTMQSYAINEILANSQQNHRFDVNLPLICGI